MRGDRDAYRALLREHVQGFDVSVLDYCVTSNHVHLLVEARERSAISGFVREVASEFARSYNRRKHRETDIVDHPDHMWVLQESTPAYGQEMGLKNVAED